MKRVFILFFLIIVFMSCELEFKSDDSWYEWEIMNLVHDTIEYVPDSVNFGYAEYWQSPEQTRITKKGDCEDFSIYMLSLLEYGYLYGYNTKAGGQHAVVKINNKFFDPVLNQYSVDEPPGFVSEICKIAYEDIKLFSFLRNTIKELY